MATLNTCPFCGGEATIDNAGGKYQVWCKRCSCIHMGEFYNTEAEAIAAWNRRADHIRDTTKKVSNADRIRGMSDEELAGWVFGKCQKQNECCNEPNKSCKECTLDWLKQPVKEELK